MDHYQGLSVHNIEWTSDTCRAQVGYSVITTKYPLIISDYMVSVASVGQTTEEECPSESAYRARAVVSSSLEHQEFVFSFIMAVFFFLEISQLYQVLSRVLFCWSCTRKNSASRTAENVPLGVFNQHIGFLQVLKFHVHELANFRQVPLGLRVIRISLVKNLKVDHSW